MPHLPRLLVAALAALAIAPASALADGWSPAVAVSPAGASSPAIAADASGVSAAWVRGGVVEVARRGPSGTFPDAQALSGAGASLPALASNAGGRAVAVWVRDGIVHAALRPAAGQPFGPAQPVSGAGAAEQPRAGVDADGNVTLAWARGGLVEIVRRSAAATAWPAPQQFAEDAPAHVALGVAPNGAATAVWSAAGGAVFTVRTSARHPGQATFGAASTLEAAEDVAGAQVAPDVTVDAAGNATAVWPNHLLEPYRAPVVRAARRTAAGAFAAPQTISGGSVNDDADPPRARVAGNAAGDTVAVWNRGLGDLRALGGARRLAGAGFEQAAEVSGSGVHQDDAPAVAVDPQARAAAVWVQDGAVHASRLTAGFAPPVPLSGTGAATPRVLFDASGGAVAAWVRAGRVETSAYDVAPPQLANLAVPSTSGQDAAFAADARDAESAVTVTWRFGDGATAQGAAVSHRYAAGGTYTVTVTATDGGGNAVSETRTGTVAGAAGDAPEPRTEPETPRDFLVDCGCGRRHVPEPAEPVLSALRVTARLRAGRPLRVAFRLSAAAPVTLTLERAAKGGRWKRVRGRVVAGRAGANALRFRLARRETGRLRLVATIDGGAALRRAFSVLPRP